MSIFQLQQFSINQSQSGMKICSDSLLFGALIPVDSAKRILDIGAGTGILSLMQAQKADALVEANLEIITAVELTQAAAKEAQENFDNSPWSEKLELIEQDVQSFAEQQSSQQSPTYDLIICNPPFFAEQTKTANANPLRHSARHTDTLSFHELIHSIDLLLTTTGCLFILLPMTALIDFSQKASRKGFSLIQQIEIAETSEHKPKVALLKFKRMIQGKAHSDTSKDDMNSPVRRERLNKFQEPNIHSVAVQKLLQSFLLRYR